MAVGKQVRSKGIQTALAYAKLASAEDVERSLGTFHNSEQWKTSPYLSSIIPVAFLHCLASIVKHDERDISYLMQEWLYFYQQVQTASSLQRNPLNPLDSP